MTDHDELRVLLGGYVLGGLAVPDRKLLERHLSGCPACRAELARFAPVPGLLRRVGDLSGPAHPGEDVLPRLLDEVGRDRVRRRRRTIAGVAGAAAAAVLVLVAWSVSVGGEAPMSEAPTATVVLVGPVSHGEVELQPKAWGTALTLEADRLPATGPFRLQVTARDGTRQLAATWGPTPAGRAVVSGATSIPTDQIVSVRVLGPGGALLTGPGGEGGVAE